MKIRLLVDMNISPLTVRAMSELGWDCVRVSELVRADTPDYEILELARNQARIVVTQDLDFSTLLALGGHRHPSLITFRLSTPTPALITQRLHEALARFEADLVNGCAITIDDRLMRIRRLPLR